MDESQLERRRIAVIGSGVAGIVAAHLLDRKHHVTLYERDDRLGGHTNTRVVDFGPDKGVAIDTGFIVLNDQTYPVFHRFLERLEVRVEGSDMSFSYWDTERKFGYSGASVNGLFAQRKNLFNPSFYRLLLEIRRFSLEGMDSLETGDLRNQSLGEFLETHRFSQEFQENYLLPMGASIWSTSPKNMLDYPAESLIGFFRNHGLLSLKNRPTWQTLSNRGRAYLEKFVQRFRGRIFKNTRIQWVEARGDQAVVRLEDGSEEAYDYLVLGCHADEALQLIRMPSLLQQELLRPWEYQENFAYLHCDPSAMPPLRRAWASWNFLSSEGSEASRSVYVTYAMNRLQNLRTERDYFVTLNPAVDLDSDKIIYRTRYTHPLYTLKSLETQSRLPELNLNSRILFCGSYFGHGFHEDAVKSGAAIGALFGLDL